MASFKYSHCNALDAYCATEMAVSIGFDRYALKGKIKQNFLLNNGSNQKNTIKYEMKNKRGSINKPNLKEGEITFFGENLFSYSSEIFFRMGNIPKCRYI